MGMVDRQDLREKAKGIGSSVAGTFKKGAKAAKEGAKDFAETTKQGAGQIRDDVSGGNGDSGIEVAYDREQEKYYVLADGEPYAEYESEQAAKARARNDIRDRQKRRGEFEDGEEEQDEAGRFQQFATSFAEGVNDTVSGATDGTDDEDSEGGPELAFMSGGDRDDPTLPFMSGDGDADNDGQGPTLPGFGGGGGDDSEPMLPGFGGPADGDNEPMLPGFGGGGDGEPQFPGFGTTNDGDGPSMPGFGGGMNGGSPSVPGFGMQDSNDEDGDTTKTDKERFPWMH